eukprot:1157419-Pelagomonas_calceolata.AAC.15
MHAAGLGKRSLSFFIAGMVLRSPEQRHGEIVYASRPRPQCTSAKGEVLSKLVDLLTTQIEKHFNNEMPEMNRGLLAYMAGFGRVISGHVAALEHAAELAKGKGALKAHYNEVKAQAQKQQGAEKVIHSCAFPQALAEVPVHAPRVPVLSNVTAKPFPSSDQAIRDLLARQLVEPVQAVILAKGNSRKVQQHICANEHCYCGAMLKLNIYQTPIKAPTCTFVP